MTRQSCIVPISRHKHWHVNQTFAAHARAGSVPRVFVGSIADEGPKRIARTLRELEGGGDPIELHRPSPDFPVAVTALVLWAFLFAGWLLGWWGVHA